MTSRRGTALGGWLLVALGALNLVLNGRQLLSGEGSVWDLAFAVLAVALLLLGAGQVLRARRAQEEPDHVELAGPLRAEVVELVGRGEQVRAIRLVRQRTGAGLVAARRAVDDVP